MSNNTDTMNIPADLLNHWIGAAAAHTDEELEDKIAEFNAELGNPATTASRAKVLRTLTSIAEKRLED